MEEQSTGLFWLSFADSSLPPGSQFLGVTVIRAREMTEAIEVAHILKINPGGEVCGHPVIYDHRVKPIPDSYIERLLNREEIDIMLAEIEPR